MHNNNKPPHIELAHSMLDWYFATDDEYLKELKVLDEQMQPV